MLILLPHRSRAWPYHKGPYPSSFQSLFPSVLWKGNQFTSKANFAYFWTSSEQNHSLFQLFYNGFSFTQIVRFTHVIAYRNSSLPHVVLYLRISHSLIYLPSLPLRAIWVISSWEIILHWAFFLMLPIACHPPAP